MGRIINLERIPFLGPLCKRISREGEEFFQSGSTLVDFLGRLARSLKQGKVSELASFYDPAFKGKRLGLTEFSVASERDGISQIPFHPDGAAIGAQSAIEEWQIYIGRFKHIEELGLHVHRVEDWRTPGRLVASVRFEVIGTQNGEFIPELTGRISEWPGRFPRAAF